MLENHFFYNNLNYMIIKPIKLSFPENDDMINDKVIFFDISHINNKITVIMPVYTKIPQIPNDEMFKLIYKTKEIHFEKKQVRLSYEPIIVIIFDFTSDNTENTITVKYNNIQKDIVLQNIKLENKYNLSLTTLFKDDYYLLDMFYNYYKSQGVEYFYLYYNGMIDNLVDKLKNSDKLKKLLDNDDITFIEWNYKYWNEIDKNNKNKNHDKNKHLVHHAQLGQIHSALYNYGKNTSEYMIFCDLDEYMTIKSDNNIKIIDYINENNNCNCFVFKNCWSKTLDSTIPDIFPNKFLTSKPFSYPSRSKCIYRTNKALILGIHEPRNYLEYNDKNIMYHFYSWSNTDRKLDDIKYFDKDL